MPSLLKLKRNAAAKKVGLGKQKKKVKTLAPNKKITKKFVKAKAAAKSLDLNNMKRPDFNAAKKKAAKLEASLATGDNSLMTANLTNEDLAAPHRAPYARIRDLIKNGTKASIKSRLKYLFDASIEYENAFRKVKSTHPNKKKYTELADLYEKSRENAESILAQLPAQNNIKKSTTLGKRNLIIAVNNLCSNAPGLGPHSTANQPVSDRLHVNASGIESEPLTPRSEAARKAFPTEPIAVASSTGKSLRLVSTSGSLDTVKLSHPSRVVKVGSVTFRGSLYTYKGKTYTPLKHDKSLKKQFAQNWKLV